MRKIIRNRFGGGAWDVFAGLFLFFIVLPIGSCVACGSCTMIAGTANQPAQYDAP